MVWDGMKKRERRLAQAKAEKRRREMERPRRIREIPPDESKAAAVEAELARLKNEMNDPHACQIR